MELYVDTTSKALVASAFTTRRVLQPSATVGDTVPVVLSFLERNPQPMNTGAPVYNYLDLSASGIVLSIGERNAAPSFGFFTLTFGSDTTPALDYDASSYDVASALNALPSVVTAGGVSVAGYIGGPFSIAFLSNGAQSLISASAIGLVPASSSFIVTSTAGTTGSPAIQRIAFAVTQAANVSSWTQQAAPAVTVTSLTGNVVQRVAIPAGTYGGSFTLTYGGHTTAAIPFAAQLDVVQDAMNSLSGVAGVTVWPGQNFWDITIPGGSSAITGDASGLICPLTLTGSLVLTSPAVAGLLDGEDSAAVPIYIQATTPSALTYYAGVISLSLA